jgi:hypothetical protein
MAKKTNVMKLEQQSWGQADVVSRWHAALPSALYLMQLRLPKLRISPAKRKLTVIMDAETGDAVLRPVKIRHLA